MAKQYTVLHKGKSYPDLISIDGDVTIYIGTKVPNLKFINGNADIFTDVPNLESIIGNVYIYPGVNLPKLKIIEGDIHIREDDLNLPNIKYIKGNVHIF